MLDNSSGLLNELRYRVGPLRPFPLVGNVALVYLPACNRVLLLPKHDIDRLSDCSEFLTLAAHAENIECQLPTPSSAGEIRGWLETQAANGVLMSYPDFLNVCASALVSSDRPVGRVDWLAIPTRCRTEALLGSVRSYVENIRTHGHQLRICVSEQAPPPGVETATSRAQLCAFACETGSEIFYAGVEEKCAFIDVLCSTGSIPSEVARFALFGRTDASANIGANRNAALLQTTGSMLISVDDDTRCETARVPESGSEIRFCSEMDPTEAWFFGDRSAGCAFLPRLNLDFVGGHTQLLGRRVGEVLALAAENGGADLKAACPHMMEYLCFGSGDILSTYSGLAGDAGVYSAFSFLIHPSRATRDRLRASPESYVQNVRSGDVVRQALCATLAHGPGAAGLATCMGLDNREILPPFFPPYRSEDGIFAQSLAHSYEGSCLAHVPFTVMHDRQQRRAYGDVLTVRMSDLVLSALAACPMSMAEMSPTARLERFGKSLIFLGMLDDTEFYEWAQTSVLARAAAIGRSVEAALRRDACFPDYWAEDLSGIIERISRAALDPDYIVPDEVRDCGGLHAAREIIGQFGELLSWWPTIVERTKALLESGIQIGSRLS